ncbi:MAG: hypothetical protein V1806_11605 [Pseudomonadota bacterium]
MSSKRIGLAWLLGASLLFMGCAAPWHNPATGETRSSVPTYPECQKREKMQGLDRYCWRTCMDRSQALRGVRNAAACEQECYKDQGEMVVDDDDCNVRKARQEGWTTK